MRNTEDINAQVYNQQLLNTSTHQLKTSIYSFYFTIAL